jgi:5'-3' exonuclease
MDLIIDVKNLAYSAYFTMRGLSHRELKTGVMFGFIKQLITIGNHLREKKEKVKFQFAFDHKRNYRKAIYPSYKEGRAKNSSISVEDRAEINRQVDRLREKVLPEMGFRNIFHQVGYEADDIMWYLAAYPIKYGHGHFENVYNNRRFLVTSDKDMYQCLNFCNIYHPKNKEVVTPERFYNRYGIPVYKWADCKAYTGCDSDEVEGIKGIADPAHSTKSTILKFFRKELKESSKAYEKITSREGKRIYYRNMRLVKIPYISRHFPPVSVEVRKDKLTDGDIRVAFDEYGFHSLLKGSEVKKWKKVFL